MQNNKRSWFTIIKQYLHGIQTPVSWVWALCCAHSATAACSRCEFCRFLWIWSFGPATILKQDTKVVNGPGTTQIIMLSEQHKHGDIRYTDWYRLTALFRICLLCPPSTTSWARSGSHPPGQGHHGQGWRDSFVWVSCNRTEGHRCGLAGRWETDPAGIAQL